MSNNTYTPGPWMMATSNSYRRILSERGEPVCVPTKQPDGHPDLHFGNGGFEGPDANLMVAAPGLYESLKKVIQYVPFQTIRCKGDKCREPWCESCRGEEQARETLEQVRAELDEARVALLKARGEKQ